MDNLNFPAEILLEIFRNLSRRDLTTAMIVNNRWRQFIDDNLIFDTVALHSRIDFNGFMSMNRAHHKRGDNVRRLIVDIGQVTSIEVEALPLLIRNVDEIHFYVDWRSPALPFTYGLQPDSLSETIRKILEIGSCVLTKCILTGQICPNLTEIFTSGSGNNSLIQENFIHLLRNAPELRSLKLNNFRFNLEDLETLHAMVPQL